LNRSRTYRTEAIVLKAQDYGETDKLLTLLTPQVGKLRAVAKGVRKPNSRMGGHLDLFTRSNLFLARGRNLDIVTQAVALEHFTAMRHDLARSTYAHYVADLLDGFTVEGMAGTHCTTLH
jgi:DNA repair protein RecO (recombination protein O)